MVLNGSLLCVLSLLLRVLGFASSNSRILLIAWGMLIWIFGVLIMLCKLITGLLVS